MLHRWGSAQRTHKHPLNAPLMLGHVLGRIWKGDVTSCHQAAYILGDKELSMVR